jgi:hypothetical protein
MQFQPAPFYEPYYETAFSVPRIETHGRLCGHRLCTCWGNEVLAETIGLGNICADVYGCNIEPRLPEQELWRERQGIVADLFGPARQYAPFLFLPSQEVSNSICRSQTLGIDRTSEPVLAAKSVQGRGDESANLYCVRLMSSCSLAALGLRMEDRSWRCHLDALD